MTRICYREQDFAGKTWNVIEQANEIIAELASEGYVLTLRQLYYQFVARDLIPNNLRSYKRLGSILNNARLAGLVDWESIEDRTRSLRALPHWDDPEDAVNSMAEQYGIDLWDDQKFRPEVWIEKDALVSVAERVADKWDVPVFSCRGYSSQSAMWRAGERMKAHLHRSDTHGGLQIPIVLYLGDHDPSGLQMFEDIGNRLAMFVGIDEMASFVLPIALTREQINEYKPPPNPAKQTDARYKKYVLEHGKDCWELDALHPRVIASVIDKEIRELVILTKWKSMKARQEREREDLRVVAGAWDDVVEYARDNEKE